MSVAPMTDRNYQELAKYAIRRVWDHHDELTESLLIVDVREAIEKAVREAIRPEGPRCPFPWTGDNGSVAQCLERHHCGCNEKFGGE